MNCLNRVYHYLKDNGSATSLELSEELGFNQRTITENLKRLLDVREIGKRVGPPDRGKPVYFKIKRVR